jgi:anti-sigma B factor antagonist
MVNRVGPAPRRTGSDRHAPRSFAVRTTTDGSGGIVLAVSGDLDVGSARLLASQVQDALHDRIRSLTIDLADLGFMDSTGVSVLVGAWRAAERADVVFALASPPEQARRVLEITGTIVLFRII